ASAKRCIADPGPPRTITIPGLQRIIPLRFMLRCAQGHDRATTTAASCEEPTSTCGRICSIVSGLLFTMKTATPTCRAVSASLLLGDAGAFDHRRPLADVAGETGLQFLGRAGPGFDPKLGVALLHLGRRHDLANRLVQERDDVRRRAVRSEHAVPRNHLVAGN